MTVASVRRHGTGNGKRRIARLRTGSSSALVRSPLDTASPFLTCAILASVNETILDATTAGSAFVTLLARLLTVDAGVLDLLALRTDTATLKSGVAVLMCEKIRMVTLELTTGHHVRMAHLVSSIELTVRIHIGRRGMMRVVASMLLLRSDFALVVLSRVTVEVLTRVGKVGAHLRCAVLAHLLLLLLMTSIGLRRNRGSRVRTLFM